MGRSGWRHIQGRTNLETKGPYADTGLKCLDQVWRARAQLFSQSGRALYHLFRLSMTYASLGLSIPSSKLGPNIKWAQILDAGYPEVLKFKPRIHRPLEHERPYETRSSLLCFSHMTCAQVWRAQYSHLDALTKVWS